MCVDCSCAPTLAIASRSGPQAQACPARPTAKGATGAGLGSRKETPYTVGGGYRRMNWQPTNGNIHRWIADARVGKHSDADKLCRRQWSYIVLSVGQEQVANAVQLQVKRP